MTFRRIRHAAARSAAHSRGSSARHGFTLVELLAVIAIIGVLVGLLLPAVQNARESARRSACTNKLKQLGLAYLNFHDAQGRMPSSWRFWWNPLPVSGAVGNWSGVTYVLPFMERSDVHDHARTFFGDGVTGKNPGDYAANQFVGSSPVMKVEDLLCASDPQITFSARAYMPLSYRQNAADAIYGPSQFFLWTTQTYMLNQFKRQPHMTMGRLSQVTDGLSKTFMLGEAVIGDASADKRTSYATVSGYQNNAAISSCIAAPATAQPASAYAPIDAYKRPGACWANATPGYSWFFTAQPPNSPRCSSMDSSNSTGPDYTMVPLSSNHGGGAQAVMCDGAVRWVADSIDTNNSPDGQPTSPTDTSPTRWGVLGALGTARQGETVSLD